MLVSNVVRECLKSLWKESMETEALGFSDEAFLRVCSLLFQNSLHIRILSDPPNHSQN